MIPLNKIAATANDLAGILGVNVWDLQTGLYNGEAFFLAQGVLDRLNARFNPAEGVIDAASSLFGASDPEQNTDLGMGTMLKTTDISDKGKAKLQVFTPPNNHDVFEDMGWYGETISFNCIIGGPNYDKANRNFFYKAMSYDKKVVGKDALGKDNLHVLVHPVWGTMDNVRLIAYERVFTGKLWRANIWKLTFRTSKPYLMKKDEDTPGWWDVANLVKKASNVLTIAQGLMNTYGAVSAYINIIDNATSNSINSSANNTTFGVSRLVRNFAPSITDDSIINPTYDATYVLPQMQYFDKMSPADVNSLVNLINVTCEASITLLEAENSNLYYKLIEDLQATMTGIGTLAASVMKSCEGSTIDYLVPFDMNMLILCKENGLDYTSQSSTIFNLNTGIIFSYNYISKGLTITIPAVV